MDFSLVKSLEIPEGTVKAIRIGNTTVWQKPSAVVSYGVSITNDNTSNIMDFYLLKETSLTFQANYNVPPEEENITPSWSITGTRPQGVNVEGATVYGFVDHTCTFTLTVSVTKGSYSDSKQFTFEVTSDGYGVTLTNNIPDTIIIYSYYTLTYNLNATCNVPASAGTLTYYAYFLPDGLTLNSSTGVITGRPTKEQTVNAYLYATCAPYRSLLTIQEINVVSYLPTFDASSVTITLEVTDVRKLANEGTVIATVDVSGKYINPAYYYDMGLSHQQTTVKAANDSSGSGAVAFPVQHTGLKGDTTPMLEFDYTAKTTNSDGTSVGTISVKLITRTTLGVTALMNSGNNFMFYLYASNYYGYGSIPVYVNYTP